MAIYMMCFTGGTPIGAPLVGMISDALGARAGVLWSGGIAALAAVGAAVVLSRRRGVRLRTEVGQVLPHPSLRMRWASADDPDEVGSPADVDLVSERRRAG
jgi:predicted MFS family arabinose efflux permease